MKKSKKSELGSITLEGDDLVSTDDLELTLSEVEVEEYEDEERSKTSFNIVKKLLFALLFMLFIACSVYALYVFSNRYVNSMVKIGVENQIKNFGYNEEALYTGKYLAITKEGEDILIRPKDKKFSIDFKDWINQYFTITGDELEISNGSLQEYSFEVYYLLDDDKVDGWEWWMHCEVYRNMVIVKDAKGEASEEETIKMAKKFVEVIEPQLNKAKEG